MYSEVDANHYEVNNEKVRANCGWITKEFLQEVISRREGNEDVRVVGSEVKAAVGVGDNYLSIMYQMTAELVNEKTGRTEKRQFLIKGLPTAKILRTMIEEYGIFRKELYMYRVCLPALKRIMEEHMPDEADFIAAESYSCNLPNVVVLEDLKVSGYRMAQRRQQLDFDHTATTVRTLARFHSLSYKLVQANPDVITEISVDDLYCDEKKMSLNSQVGKALEAWMEVFGEHESTRHLVPIMERVTKNMLDKIIHVVGKRDNSFVTVNHGDSWSNNFMYKYDKTGNVIHAKMVDFQITRYSSPALDLLYFLFSSTKPEMLANRFEEIIMVYHEALSSDMKALQVDSSEVPSLDDIHRELRERSIFAIMAMVIVAPIVVAKPSNIADLESVDEDAWNSSEAYLLKNNFYDTYYHEVVTKYMAIMEKLGYLKSAEELVPPPRENQN